MKKLLLAVSIVVASLVGPGPISPVAKANNYTWQCSVQTYCGVNIWGNYSCWQRQQCCEQYWNSYTGAYAWRCVWN